MLLDFSASKAHRGATLEWCNRTRSLPILSSTFSEFLPEAFTKSSSGSPAGLRRLNVARVYETIRKNGSMTRQLIGKVSGLSKPTINEALDILLQEKLITLEDPKSDSTGGRPGPKAQQVTFNKVRKHVLAIDIGGSKIRVLISDLAGDLVVNLTEPIPKSGGRKSILEAIKKLTDLALSTVKFSINDIGSVVAGSPGTIDAQSGVITRAYNIPDWENFSLSHELSKLLNTNVQVENEAHLAVYGEYWQGASKGLENIATMSVGVGIGLGLLINGRVHKGFKGIAGEVGNLPLEIEKPTTEKSQAGFEFFASAVGLERTFDSVKNSIEAKNINELANGQKVTAKIIYEAAAQGDSLALNLVHEQLDLLGRGIASICSIVNPEVFILAGGLAPSLAPHLSELHKIVAKYTLAPPIIEISALQDLATAYGALRRGIENIDKTTLVSILQETA